MAAGQGDTMRTIAPEVFRQRLLVEGYWTVAVSGDTVRDYLLGLAGHLELRTYGEPVVYSPASGMGRDENAGWDAFVPLIDSGISGYFWNAPRFLSVVVYACKAFDAGAAVAFTRDYFSIDGEIVSLSF